MIIPINKLLLLPTEVIDKEIVSLQNEKEEANDNLVIQDLSVRILLLESIKVQCYPIAPLVELLCHRNNVEAILEGEIDL